MADSQSPPEWTKKYPAPKAKTEKISADGLMDFFDAMDLEAVGGRKFLCVDVRREDWIVSFISSGLPTGAIQIYQHNILSTKYDGGGSTEHVFIVIKILCIYMLLLA